METRTLVTFLKAVELKNFYQVAQVLGYAPSTITMQIKSLEEELGFPLFDRIGKKIALTSSGLAFLPYANKIVALNEEAHNLNSKEKEPQGNILCGSIESYMSNVLSFYLPIFVKSYPKINISIKLANTGPLLRMLKLGELDLIFCLDNEIGDSDLYCVYRHAEPLIFAASPKHKLAGRKKIPLKEVFAQRLILSEKSGRYRTLLDKMATDNDASICPLIAVDNVTAISNLVRKNLGITFLPEYSLRREIMRKRLVPLDVDANLGSVLFQIYYNKNKWLSPALSQFIQFIVNEEHKAFI